ncbi:hypothetical protein E1162_17125 [Rhodobacteraceae bacterium RKSG542]|uniref:hypothetical protein n=1 Tax=Pseudovibrio flavus TaxID=2529854 RepID=UPI0012BD5DAD|nr:hypothetical protein [Pseudovibrio flavus]MTI18969.1 hypothetical protein [Pseudovibrio flavus]
MRFPSVPCLRLNLLASVVCGLSLATGVAASELPLTVTTGADDGPGSLREALAIASESSKARPIYVVTNDVIEIGSTLTYTGEVPLVLYGSGQTIHSKENVTLLALTSGADLTASDLRFVGPGGFSVMKRGDADGSGGKGIFIDVRDDQTGTLFLRLDRVTVTGVAYHGIHVSDCDLADACGGGSGGGGDGASASIAVQANGVVVADVGNGAFDADGIRIDERGDGGIYFISHGSSFRDVGADGVELDEGGAGSVLASVVGNQFVDNGGYCDPVVLQTYMPQKLIATFDDGKATDADVPADITGSPDDDCFEKKVETYPSGSIKSYEISIDLDDGIDIDEAGEGNLTLHMNGADVLSNLDEGVDVGEEDDGSLAINVVRSTVNNNKDDGIRAQESGAGDLFALVQDVTAQSNGRYGARYDHEGDGTFSIQVSDTETADNGEAGIRASQTGGAKGTLTVSGSNIENGIDARNVTVTEQ